MPSGLLKIILCPKRRFNLKPNELITSLILFSLVISVLLLNLFYEPSVGVIHEKHIVRSAQKGIDYLIRLQHENGQIVESNTLFDVWETIQAVRAISLWHKKDSLNHDQVIKSALEFIRNSEAPNGMVLHNSNHQNSYCLETSAEYIILLSDLEKKNMHAFGFANKKAMVVKKTQLPIGCWNIESSSIPEHLQRFPSVTGFALGALESVNETPINLHAALEYLKDSQKKDGHWGFVWQYYGTPYYAMVPILEVVKRYNTDGLFNIPIQRARRFLIASQQKNGAFLYKTFYPLNKPSIELQTVLGLRALINCTGYDDDIEIRKGILWLLKHQQDDGSWDGGRFSLPNPFYRKKENIFCTSQVLILLHQYLSAKNKVAAVHMPFN